MACRRWPASCMSGCGDAGRSSTTPSSPSANATHAWTKPARHSASPSTLELWKPETSPYGTATRSSKKPSTKIRSATGRSFRRNCERRPRSDAPDCRKPCRQSTRSRRVAPAAAGSSAAGGAAASHASQRRSAAGTASTQRGQRRRRSLHCAHRGSAA